MKFDGKVYEILKWTSLIFLPALTTLVASLGLAFGWTDIDKITITINAVATFIGTLIGVSTINYNKEIKG